MPWKISEVGSIYGLNIENETPFDFKVTIKVNTASFPKNQFLGISNTGNCGVGYLQPKQTITCTIGRGGHLELSYLGNIYSPKPFSDIEGSYTLEK